MKNQFESAQNIIEIYKKHARAWTELRGNFLYEKTWLDHFLSLIPQHSEILDLGCGSGKPIADYLIQHDHKIIGVDSSDVMIEMASKIFLNSTGFKQTCEPLNSIKNLMLFWHGIVFFI